MHTSFPRLMLGVACQLQTYVMSRKNISWNGGRA